MTASALDAAVDAFARGHAHQAAGDDRAAAAAFLMAFALAPDEAAYRAAAFDTLNVMTGYDRLPPAIMAALTRAAQDAALDLQPLSLVVRNLITADARLPALREALAGGEAATERILTEAEWLLEHPLLLPVLARAVNISAEIEGIFTALRRHLCLAVARGKDALLLTRYRTATVAMTQQCITNRYIWQEDRDESAALAVLAGRSDNDALLIRAAYRPLIDVDPADVPRLPPALAELWREETDERRRAANMRALTPLAPGLSETMRVQYETYPYPRWRRIRAQGRHSLHAYLAHRIPHMTFDAALDGDVDVLVAGCGTGLPALTLACSLSRGRILAVDLSRASLAYAARMAEHLGADNIDFAIADILHLAHIPRRFDFIECSGVLHHMDDPAAGLAALVGLLRPHGVMKIALYSERGRAAEVAAQRYVKERGFPDTTAGLRAARAGLLDLPIDHPARPVVDTPDFFTRDGLHDLIFNIHESRTSPAMMKRLLKAHGLEAIAVEAPPLLGGNAFRTEHPDRTAWSDLDLWDEFEARHPEVFAHMIQVWCRPPKGNQ